MGFFIKDGEIATIKSAPSQSREQVLYRALLNRCCKNTAEDKLVQSADTQEWYHLVWERMSDAAFIYAAEGNEKIGKWVHDRTLEIVRMPEDSWIGPNYRNHSVHIGSLETAHISLAVCEAYENGEGLFDESEKEEIRNVLRSRALVLCRAYCEKTINEKKWINNWFSVLLCGYGTVALVLGESEDIKKALEMAEFAAGLYSSNDYGESLQYANYAALLLSTFFENALRSGIDARSLPAEKYACIVTWFAVSYLGSDYSKSLGTEVTQSLNFGDCAAIFRPSGDLLMHISARLKRNFPREAGLSSFLFDTVYSESLLGAPDELASFGMINQFGYRSLLLYAERAEGISPRQASVCESMCFDGGQVIVKDSVDSPKAVFAVAAGYKPYKVTAHRHLDAGSFQAYYGGERIFVDPGHCCYRLEAQKKSVDDTSHSTLWLKSGEKKIGQRAVYGNVFTPSGSASKKLFCGYIGNTFAVASDMAGLFAKEIVSAIRVFVIKPPHMMFIIDVVKSTEPVSLVTNFVINNCENRTKMHIYNDHKLVIRRTKSAAKLFELESTVDGEADVSKLSQDYSYTHEYYSPLPNMAGQGKEGSALVFRWSGTKEGLENTRISSVSLSEERIIPHWHMGKTEDGFFRIDCLDNKDYLEIKLDGERVIVRQPGWDDGEIKL